MKLLIVDDSNIMRRVIEKYSGKYGLEVVGSAENGVRALDLFQQTLPDLVTLDITMPEMDGLAALVKMKAILPSVKVIIISALSDKKTALEAMEKGATAYVQKPFTEDKLDTVLKKVLG